MNILEDIFQKSKSASTGFSLHYPFEFPIHNIDCVYMFGCAYDICVKYRPIGYKFWDRQTNCKVYFFSYGY